MNPHSRANRKVHPTNFRPAVLKDFSLHYTSSGFATLREEPGDEVHGVVMEFQSEAEWQVILDIESAYNCKELTIKTYDGKEVKAYAFFMIDKLSEGKPQERYLKIIAEGLKHHGVKPEYVENLFKVEFRPSRKPENYLSFPIPADKELPTLTFEEYLERSKTKPCAIIHDKVIDLVGEYDDNNPLIRVWQVNHCGKTCMAPTLRKAVYDPDLTDDIELHRWAEDHLMDVIIAMGMEGNFQVGARIDPQSYDG